MRNLLTFIATLGLCASTLLSGCMTANPPSTIGEIVRQEGSYGYTPIDPLPINYDRSDEDVLSSLPDITMRLAVGSFDISGNISYGPVKTGVAGSRYQIVMDYIQYTTLSIPVTVKDITKPGAKKKEFTVDILADEDAASADKNIPVYVGIGLRLIANVTALKNNVDLSNLVAIGVAAQNNEIHGTLTVQAMGISGETVAEILPMPSTLDQSTIQQALMALGNIKSKSYLKDKTVITPRVIAVYNPFNESGPLTVSGLIELILLDQGNLKLHKAAEQASKPKPNLTTKPTTQPQDLVQRKAN